MFTNHNIKCILEKKVENGSRERKRWLDNKIAPCLGFAWNCEKEEEEEWKGDMDR